MAEDTMKYNFYKVSEFYRYCHRSCRNCEKRDRCDALKKDWSAPWLDMGRCGCMKYSGPFEEEKQLFKDLRGRMSK